ncbi:MAG: Na/Pi cotransporter family protein [Lachnospiraceae bacterium]
MGLQNLELLFKFIGGLGLFLFGMNSMAEGLQKSSGDKLKHMLGVLTNNRFLGVLMGAAVTAIIQSSSATTVIIVGFVNAGIMNLTQAVGVIMGANIGTTVTSWIVSMGEWSQALKPEFIAPLFIGIGAFLLMFTKTERKRDIGQIILGFGVLFIGLTFMSDSIIPYKDSPIFTTVFSTLGKSPILGILAGTVVTGIIQSSSASVGILQTLAANGVVNWSSAIYITLGQNIGTCVTALISSTGAKRNGRRAAVIHLLFNSIGAVWYGVVMYILFRLNTQWAQSNINSIQISMFHTIFNITNTIVLFPFANKLVQLSSLLVKEKPGDREEDEFMINLEDRFLESPSFAIEAAVAEVVQMGNLALDNYKLGIRAVLEDNEADVKQVIINEKRINLYEEALAEYLVKVNELPLNENQYKLVKNLLYSISDLERIGDHSENLAEIATEKKSKNIEFSTDAKEELLQMSDYVSKSLEAALVARSSDSLESVRLVSKYEDIVDELETDLREKHIQRLADRLCTAGSGVIYLDIISNLERISDHAHNIAGYVKSEI